MITIRNFQDSDYPVLCELDAPMFSGMGGPILFRHIQELFGDLFLVAEMDGDIIGYILGGVHLEDAARGKLIRIGVCPGHQRKECGTQLTAELFSRMKSRGVTSVHVTVALENSAARSFYAKIGFVQKEIRENYFYPDIPRLVLEKTL
ncbi:MAG TPA: GNAT family N-acetyltransferase [Methanocorpusculum sp.]|nr:GNAT family N-acetyltransferase [Methanocorpusculum sp.]HJJ41280.1 GNAT family N-acetyltransferase [Methanocorpusculum sp.]